MSKEQLERFINKYDSLKEYHDIILQHIDNLDKKAYYDKSNMLKYISTYDDEYKKYINDNLYGKVYDGLWYATCIIFGRIMWEVGIDKESQKIFMRHVRIFVYDMIQLNNDIEKYVMTQEIRDICLDNIKQIVGTREQIAEKGGKPVDNETDMKIVRLEITNIKDELIRLDKPICNDAYVQSIRVGLNNLQQRVMEYDISINIMTLVAVISLAIYMYRIYTE